MTEGRIFFSENIASDFINYCTENKKEHIIFICDGNTEKYCLPYFKNPSHVISIPSGEQYKNIDTYSLIIKQLIFFKANKSSLIVNLGGGVVTDIGGFAASTYMRGLNFIHIPTTLIGMVDASIGGKTGIDFQLYKNYLGSFSLPEIVFIYPGFLKTLQSDEVLSGFSEMIKTGIVANSLLFNKLASKVHFESLIQLTAETKQQIVEKDFYDKGNRQLLNFGHTIGHAFETHRLKIGLPVLHGFAIAKGMLAESRIAFHLNLIDQQELNQIHECIIQLTHQSELTRAEFEVLKPFLFFDKKNFADEIVFSLPTGIGSGKPKIIVNLEVIQASLFYD